MPIRDDQLFRTLRVERGPSLTMLVAPIPAANAQFAAAVRAAKTIQPLLDLGTAVYSCRLPCSVRMPQGSYNLAVFDQNGYVRRTDFELQGTVVFEALPPNPETSSNALGLAILGGSAGLIGIGMMVVGLKPHLDAAFGGRGDASLFLGGMGLTAGGSVLFGVELSRHNRYRHHQLQRQEAPSAPTDSAQARWVVSPGFTGLVGSF